MTSLYSTSVSCQTLGFASNDRKPRVKPERAIVLSDVPGRNGCLVTVHDIRSHGDVHSIGAGHPVDPDILRKITEAAGAAPKLQLLPRNLLASSLNAVVWWVPGAQRAMHIRVGQARKTVQVMWPTLLLASKGNSLRIYSLADAQQPVADTPLYHAPIGNVGSDGVMCWGSVPSIAASVEAIPLIESAVFDTAFSHPNAERLLNMPLPSRQFQGGYQTACQDIFKYWLSAAARTKRLGKKELIEAKLTLGDLISELDGD